MAVKTRHYKDNIICIRVEQRVKDKLRSIANEYGISISELIRSIVITWLGMDNHDSDQ